MTLAKAAAAFLLTFVLVCGAAVPAHAATSSEDFPLTSIRAVRVSATSITFSFITDIDSLGKVEYTELDGTTITLTDAAPQHDHLFTIDALDPSHGYTFSLSAQEGRLRSYRYSTLLAPELIGQPGQSIVPPIDVFSLDGVKVSSSFSASTTAATTHTPSAWLFLIVAVGALAAWVLYAAFLKPRTYKTSQNI